MGFVALEAPPLSLSLPPLNPPPHFLSPLFPTPVHILGSNGAITRATLDVIPWHNTITSNTWIYVARVKPPVR